ncbi:MAG: DNA polymerase III subunit delta, partial [Alphaproteobacteria bacterium]
MKYSNSQLTRFQKSQDPAIRAALIYGPDEGLVRERAKTLVTAIAEDPRDPFRVVEMDMATILDDPARLADEAAAISMMGGRRVVRITGAGDRLTKNFATFLDDLPGDGFIVVSAGELAAKSSLRKLFEASDTAFTVACFSDNAETRDALIDSILIQAGHQ